MQWEIRPFIVPWLVLALVLVWLAATIYRRQAASRVGRLFCLILGLVAVWFASFAVMFATTQSGVASVAARIALAAVALIPAGVYDFTSTALRIAEQRRGVILASRALGTTFAALILFTSAIIEPSPQRYEWGFYPRFTEAGGLAFIIFFVSALTLHLIDGWREYRHGDDPRRRRRIGELITGFLIVYVSTLDFRPLFGIDARPVSYIPVAAFVIFAWGSIRRHRLTPITAARAATDILETMVDALFVLDRDGRIRVLNGAVTSLFGYAPSEVMGRSIDFFSVDSKDRSLVDEVHARLTYGPIRDHEGVFRHRDGHVIDVSISASALHDRESEGGSVVIVRDIRERKRDEQERQEFVERLQQSNRELEDFAHVASHDLQEPLRKIQAFGDRLVSRFGESIPPEGRDYLQRMQNAAERMQGLINDLLSFSRITTKARPFTPVELSAVASEVVHDLEIAIQESGGAVEVGTLPRVEADPLQMRQLLQNLIGNALKFRKTDVPPRVEIRGRQRDGMATVEVRDNGIGFDQKYAERIFTIFERLHGRGVYKGTGIGLAICRKIVERHHGTITADSIPGEGTMFTIELPVRQRHEGKMND